MRTENIQLLVSLGILNPRADELTAHFVWGELLRDPIIWRRSSALPRDPEFPAMVPFNATHLVCKAMTAAEKVELRERILAKCESQGAKHGEPS